MRNQRRHSRAPLVTAVVLGLVTCGFFAVGWRRAAHDASSTRAWARTVLDSLATSTTPPGPPIGPEGRDSVYWQWVATSAQLQTRRWQQALRYANERHGTLLEERDVAALKSEGLADPARQLRDSLMDHPELVHFKDKAGGSEMAFVAGRVVVLGRPFVFARFENGRAGGQALFAYRISEGPRVRWRRLWAEMDE